ncbi:hypothetical protein C8F04DRAFT_1234918 [Mycena alexandri]|uniref:Uncharacterized protein n=1 Tax=Mycena alexandri TaxID=1745969 RepID=A0AAD6WL99_9AGAR|nr:hypothetical protein C8F04DRAFT_1244937 [Mycena alexandri]KAJ7033083.1 hypothetical protein C8F04DRAFT_1234918 [Mycena alexandri]
MSALSRRVISQLRMAPTFIRPLLPRHRWALRHNSTTNSPCPHRQNHPNHIARQWRKSPMRTMCLFWLPSPPTLPINPRRLSILSARNSRTAQKLTRTTYQHSRRLQLPIRRKLREAPTIPKAATAVKDLTAGGYKDPKHDPFVRVRLEGMRIFLNLYTDLRSKTYGHWGASALQAAVGLGRGTHCMRSLCQLARQYIHDRKLLVVNPYGSWKETMLADEDLAADINLYLQEIGNDITAEKLVQYLARPEVMEKHGITKTISVRTARLF